MVVDGSSRARRAIDAVVAPSCQAPSHRRLIIVSRVLRGVRWQDARWTLVASGSGPLVREVSICVGLSNPTGGATGLRRISHHGMPTHYTDAIVRLLK
jgi:hypothetical protein